MAPRLPGPMTHRLLLIGALLAGLVMLGLLGLSQGASAADKDPIDSVALETGNVTIETAFSADGAYIVAGVQGDDSKIGLYLWNLTTSRLELQWGADVNSSLVDLDISDNGAVILAGLNDSQLNDVNLYSFDNSTPLWTARTQGEVQQVALSGNGRYLVVGTDNGIYFYGADSPVPIWTNMTVANCLSVAISRDGKYVAAGMADGSVSLFTDGGENAEWTFITGNSVGSVDLSAAGEHVLAGSDDNYAYLFHRDSSLPLWTHDLGADGVSVSMDDAGELMVVGAGDEGVFLFHRDVTSPLRRFSISNEEVIETVISGNGKYLTATSQANSTYWFEYDPNQGIGHNYSLLANSISTTANGLYTAVGDTTGRLLLFFANDPPELVLESPLHNVTTSETMLVWNATDADGDELTYDVYFGTAADPQDLIAVGISESVVVLRDNLTDGGTFYWKVAVHDGTHTIVSNVRNFTFNAVPPTLDITDGELSNGAYLVRGTATDEHAVVSVEIKIDDGAWKAIQGKENWTFPWRVGDLEFTGESNHTIHARSFDGFNYSAEDQLEVTLTRPWLTLGDKRFDPAGTGVYLVQGTAWGMNGIVMVQVSVDGGKWFLVDGTDIWSFNWNTENVKPGSHTLSFQAFDGVWYTPPRSITVETTGPAFTMAEVPDRLTGNHTFSGTFADGDDDDKVQIRIFNSTWSSGWKTANGTQSWTYIWNTGEVTDGTYTIEVRVQKDLKYIDMRSVTSKVANQDDDDDDGILGLLCLPLLPLLILLLLALLLLYWNQLMILLGYKERQEEECIYCGSDEQPLHHGHLVAPSKGGQKPVTACEKCNLSKGPKALMEWLRWTKVERPERWERIVKWNKEPKEGEVPEKVRKVRDEHTPGEGKAAGEDGDGDEDDMERAFARIAAGEEGDGEGAREGAEACIYCGATEKLTHDHVVFVGQEPETACTGCHLSRTDEELDDWLHRIKEDKPEKWDAVVDHNKGRRGEVPGYVRAVRDERPDTCIYCGSHEEIQETSLIAASKGGAKPVAACAPCNRSKGTKALMDWLRWTKEERPERWENIVEHNKGKRGEVPGKVRTVRDEAMKETRAEAPPPRVPRDEDENCIYCGAHEKLTDHVVLAGQEPEPACTGCHLSRRDKELDDWLRHVKENKPEKWKHMLDYNKGHRGLVASHIHTIRDEKPHICIFCGSNKNIQETSLIAASKGGKKPVPACEVCFRSKGTKAFMEWLRWTRDNREDRWETIVDFNHGKRGEVPAKVHKVRDEPHPEPPSVKARKLKVKKIEQIKQALESREARGPGECIYCGATKKITRKHLSYPGERPVVACTSCHRSKGDNDLVYWFYKTKQNRPERWEAMVAHNKGKRSRVALNIQKVQLESKVGEIEDTKASSRPKASGGPEDGACVYCGADDKLTHNHLIATGRKPVTACQSCSRSKGKKSLMVWLRWTRERKPDRWEAMVEHNQGRRGEVPNKVQKVRDE